jgi:hypothetical protein
MEEFLNEVRAHSFFSSKISFNPKELKCGFI